MTSSPKPSWLSILLLCFLMGTAFAVRVNNNLQQTKSSTIDERVYYFLAQKSLKNPFDYNLIELADTLAQENKTSPLALPSYFREPLFKHPPLFPWLLALTLKIAHNDYLGAILVPAFFGSLLILMGYLFGRLFFSETVGLFSALALWLDPINIICSQKTWMETTLSFFTLLCLYCFARGLKKQQDAFFVLGGIASGLAALTKYPGIIGTFIIGLYVVFLKPDLLRNKNFQRGLLMPFIMLIPWLLWNISVFGTTDLLYFLSLHVSLFKIFIIIGLVAGLFIVRLVLLRRKNPSTEDNDASNIPAEEEPSSPLALIRENMVLLYGFAFFAALSLNIINSLNPKHFPFVSWQGGFFRHPLFYFGRLIEFSGIYLFAFIPVFLTKRERSEEETFLLFSILGIFAFYLAWGNYQCRYILAATPLLIVMAVHFIEELYQKLMQGPQGTVAKYPDARLRRVSAEASLSEVAQANKEKTPQMGVLQQSPRRLICVGGLVGLTLLLLYFFLKTNYINFLVSYPNDLCYF